MSKTFSMAGWRMGFAVGNERLLAALARVKILSRLRRLHADPGRRDRGAQRAGRLHRRDARHLPQPPRRAGRELSARPAGRSRRRTRLDVRLGADPGEVPALGSLEFSKLLIEKADVAVAPGIGFGEHGDDYVRIALVENEQRIRQAARNLRRFFDTADQTLHNVVQMAARG